MNRTVRFLMQRFSEILVIVFLIMVMPSVPPHAKFQKSTKLPPVMPLEGKLQLNNRLDDVKIWHDGEVHGPEAFADYKGELYTSVYGSIIKFTGEHHITPVVKFGKPCKGHYEEQKCGRPLGLRFDKNGLLYAVDAYYGLFKVDVTTGKYERLVAFDQEIEGAKVKLPNSLAVASNGDIFWSDTSTEFTLQDGIFDFLADGSGRLIHYDAKTKTNKVLIKDIHFANGVVLADDESFVLVAETSRSRIYRYYLKGRKAGTYDVFIEGLPGLPDNLNSDGNDGFLVPLVASLDSDHPFFFQVLEPFPLFRKFIARLLGLSKLTFEVLEEIYPHRFFEQAIHYIGHFKMRELIPLSPTRTTIIRLSKEGVVMDAIHTDVEIIHSISEAYVWKDTLYLGSPFNDHVGRISLKTVGWSDLIKPQQQQQQQKRAAEPAGTPKPKPTATTTPTPTTPKPATTTTTTTTSKPTTTTQKPTTTTQKPTTTTTPKPATTTTPKPTTTTAKPATTTTARPATTTTTTAKPATTTTTTAKPATTTTTKKAATTTAPKPAAASTPKPASTTQGTTTAKPAASTTPPPTAATTTPPPTAAPTKPAQTAQAKSNEGKPVQSPPPPPPPPTATPKPSTNNPEVKTAPVKEQSKTVPIKESQNEKK